ncbi:flagellar hook-associated protein FlgK [Sporolactobacillus shoreae]|uniref:Flagellar hook-associated protein 1 n=1 Tax=Sporolactobacillus shoreae TaxID=1465501 RepID=A0A4Z0GGW3_9BACL|nr:flagellar hook-associated protein FlgK [Sporolactobacillus shoreae]TGA95871.1 flagellar hook-associated protein FlgK [Sporolactobacillus shoreae]
MIPIFSSLNMMQRALGVTQDAIQTTGNNISNANTPGYSRERVNLSTWYPYPASGINQQGGAGQIGTGVIDNSVTRITDKFVNQQVRDNVNQNGYWSSVSDAYSQMENIINEPTNTGISSVLDGFWTSLQDLAGNPGTSGTGSVVLQNGQEVADTFNYLSNSLEKVQNNLQQQITDNTSQINSYADQINVLNQEINRVEANGQLPNELYDQRDQLTQELSQLVNVKVTPVKSGGNPSPLAEGLYSIEIVQQNGSSFSPPATLVDGTQLTDNHLQTTIDTTDATNPKVNVSVVTTDTTPTTVSTLTDASGNTPFSGGLQGLIDSYTKDYPEVFQSLNNLANTLATNMDQVYAQNAGYTSSKGTFFLGDSSDPNSPGTVTAANIHVNTNLTGSDIVSSASGKPSGDNSSAQAMADVIATDTYDVDGTHGTTTSASGTTLKGYLQGLIGQIGVNSQSAQQLSDNSNTLLQAAQNRQSSISGVSMDEEMTNLIQYQHTYDAAAKVVTTIDTLLDTLINKMGG